ncbi:MAG: hypothetical protein ACOCZG_01565 [Halothece sp.]
MIIIAPGFHSPHLTADFLQGMGWQSLTQEEFLVIPLEIPPYDRIRIYQWLSQQVSLETPLYFIAFSAGVVGAMGVAIIWQQQGGKIEHFFALDGWGVPVLPFFPTTRISHDLLTHYTSQLLGTGEQPFYCSPPIDHLALWQNPHLAYGWWEIKCGCKLYSSVAKIISEIILRKLLLNNKL